MYDFTIAIPTLHKRVDRLTKLLTELYRQIAVGDFGERVELLTFLDDRQRNIGYKRNWLLQRAQGKFTAFVDDDDRLDGTYISRILKAIETYPDIDVIGFSGVMAAVAANVRAVERSKRRFIHSIKYDHYFEKNNVLYRCPNHLNPIRTEISRRFAFPEIPYGEDTEWAMQLANAEVLKKEHFLDGTAMYYYDYVANKRY